MTKDVHDLVIIGMGPAGYTASIYASRYKIGHLIIGNLPGGLIGQSHKVCNYPTEGDISGLDLVGKMQKKAIDLGGKEVFDQVIKIEKVDDGKFKIVTKSSGEFYSEAVLLATGLKHRHLNIPGEKEFNSRGVAYCATCDGMFFKDKIVAVIGGGDAANSASVYLADIASKVYQILRGDELKGEVAWVDLVKSNPKIELIYNNNVIKLGGKENLEYLILNKEYNGQAKLEIDGLFVEIGSEPDIALLSDLNLKADESGYIAVGMDQSTNIEGLYAAGDVTTASNRFKQVITASSEGAIATESIYKYLKNK